MIVKRYFTAALATALCACGSSSDGDASAAGSSLPDSTATVVESADIPPVAADECVEAGTKSVTYDSAVKVSADGMPQKIVYRDSVNKEHCFFVVSKVHPEHLSVYEAVGSDTVLCATYPVCIGRNKGNKRTNGDCKTPESHPGKPFSISQIQASHTWTHDFSDGRGRIPAYGAWFMRLSTPGFAGIGIHGSTNNRESIKTGRGSEGCIRLLDEDIVHLHDKYARVGTPVTVLPEDAGPLGFEISAYAKAGKKIGQERRAASSDSSVSKPASETNPAETKPAETKPAESKSAETKPAESKPAETKPAENKSAENRSAENKSAESKSSESKPAESKPAGTRTSTAEASSSTSSSLPTTVYVKGTQQRFRLGPTPNDPIYKGTDGVPVYPKDGQELKVIGQKGNYYFVRFNGKEVYINKASCR